jgi:uncharacterized membrane protein
MPRQPGVKPYQRAVYSAILIIAILWCAGIVLAPLWENEVDIRGDVSKFMYEFYSKSCHQLDERSFHLGVSKFGVCSRCTLIYFGFLLASILYPFVRKLNNLELPPIWILLTGAGLVILDAGFDIFDVWKNSFVTREISGAVIGLILPFYIIPGSIRVIHEFLTPSKIVPKDKS